MLMTSMTHILRGKPKASCSLLGQQTQRSNLNTQFGSTVLIIPTSACKWVWTEYFPCPICYAGASHS